MSTDEPTVHACPTEATPCCGRTLSELPPTDRVSGGERTVTCGASREEAMSASDEKVLIEMLRDAQARRCCYGTRHGDGRTCDCKYGLPLLLGDGFTDGPRGEMTGCPELRAALNVLGAATFPNERPA